jgi:predicted SnoaL-like aldol condensation-catalyzing enzyme
MKRIALVGLLSVTAASMMFGQAAPVVGSDDPAKLFTDKDPVLNRNKQAAMHIVIDLLEAGHWNEADKWLTERYIQHNPSFGSGREPVMKAFGSRPGRPIPADPRDWRSKVVAVLAQGDLVAVVTRVELPDPRTPGQTYTTTHYDMWRFLDGKADEHWDEGRINPPAPPKQ